MTLWVICRKGFSFWLLAIKLRKWTVVYHWQWLQYPLPASKHLPMPSAWYIHPACKNLTANQPLPFLIVRQCILLAEDVDPEAVDIGTSHIIRWIIFPDRPRALSYKSRRNILSVVGAIMNGTSTSVTHINHVAMGRSSTKAMRLIT